MDEPVKPFTTAGKSRSLLGLASRNWRQAFAAVFMFSAARWRTPSGSPSPQTCGGRIPRCRSSMLSQIACPTR